jgi:fumarate hydratase class II
LSLEGTNTTRNDECKQYSEEAKPSKESDSLCEVYAPRGALWGANTQRSFEQLNIPAGSDAAREMIAAGRLK